MFGRHRRFNGESVWVALSDNNVLGAGEDQEAAAALAVEKLVRSAGEVGPAEMHGCSAVEIVRLHNQRVGPDSYRHIQLVSTRYARASDAPSIVTSAVDRFRSPADQLAVLLNELKVYGSRSRERVRADGERYGYGDDVLNEALGLGLAREGFDADYGEYVVGLTARGEGVLETLYAQFGGQSGVQRLRSRKGLERLDRESAERRRLDEERGARGVVTPRWNDRRRWR